MDTMKIKQASEVLNTTIDKYFSFDPEQIETEQMEYLKMSFSTIQNLLEATASLLHDGIVTVIE